MGAEMMALLVMTCAPGSMFIRVPLSPVSVIGLTSVPDIFNAPEIFIVVLGVRESDFPMLLRMVRFSRDNIPDKVDSDV